jgi:hypothetical protein
MRPDRFDFLDFEKSKYLIFIKRRNHDGLLSVGFLMGDQLEIL